VNGPGNSCSAWLERLQANRTQAAEVTGPENVEVYETYLKASIRQFRLGYANLYRIFALEGVKPCR
jgi:cyclopropane-fatty-acyl-phospholipid synthase